MRQIWRIWSYFRPDRTRLIGSVGLLALSTSAGLLKPWPLAIIVDCILGSQPLPERWTRLVSSSSPSASLVRLVAIMAFLYAAHAVLVAVQNGTVIQLGLRGLGRVRMAVYDWLLRLPLGRWNALPQGEVLYRATWDTYSFQTLFTQGLFGVLGASTQVLAMTWVMAQLNVPLTLTALLTVPVLMGVMRWLGGRMARLAGSASAADTSVATRLQQTVANLLLIQSFTREPEEARQFQRCLADANQARWRQHRAELAYLAVVAGVLGVGTALLVWMGSRQVLTRSLTVGELWVFLAYLAQLYEPLNQLSQLGTTLTNAFAGSRRVVELMEEPEPKSDGTREFPRNGGRPPEIRFEAVHFSYDGRSPALDGARFEVHPGEVVALIGPSGAGKTTLLQLVPRFLDPTDGRVCINGIPVAEMALRSLRAGVSVLLQEPLLLPVTVAENLAYGRPDATRAEVEEAARQANADEFIRRLPQGYETVVGDGAARLSVGEKQRINLARAFLKNAPILLLDEPTSALDVDSESLVLEGLKTLTKNRTTLMVAHRLETLKIADRVVSLRGGRVEAVQSSKAFLRIPER
jgi:ATP-binding cassette, subfamily B, bacterial